MKKALKGFWLLFNRNEKKKILILLFLSTLAAVFEMLGISMVVPLVTAIVEPNQTGGLGVIQKIYSAFGITNNTGFILVSIALMIVLFIVKCLFLIFVNYCTTKFVYNNRLKMQKKVLSATLRKPYKFFLNVETGQMMRILRNDIEVTYTLLMMLMSAVSEMIVSLALILTVFIINPVITSLIALLLCILLIVIIKIIKPIMRTEGDKLRKSGTETYKWILQSIEGIKEIKVNRRELFFEHNYTAAGKTEAEANKKYYVIEKVPKLLIETGCICSALAALGIMIVSGKDTATLFSTFAAFAFAAIKLMPSANRIIETYSMLSYRGPSIYAISESLTTMEDDNRLYLTNNTEITLNKEVLFDRVTYRYTDDTALIFEDATMSVPAGSSVGIIGVSGAGKTTAVDIMLGLLSPEKGDVLSDGISITENYQGWLNLVGYIPQSVFLMDGTIKENIVFGNRESTDEILWKVLEEAQLADFVRQQPNGLNTCIGERGIRISGGQQQRIGIARALYNNPQLLVFDEATSSLDNETEAAIMESINSLHGKKTMLIIAHRLQTIENCDIVYEVKNKKIVRVR